jgi:Secretion system C-terminal sorting domain
MRFVLLSFICICLQTAFAQPVSVTTHRYGNDRLGWNPREKTLTTQNITGSTFGRLYYQTVDDQIYAQPLVVSNLSIGGANRNVLFVATVNNSIYAFDADRFGDALWQVSLTPTNARPPRNADMTGACDGKYKDFSGNMGIVGTPVIDTTSATLYVVSRHISASGKYEQLLNALDLTTGKHRANSPATIAATIDGTGAGSSGGKLSFDNQKHNQRSALLLHQGVVYVAWASHCDWGPYHGWVIGFDAKTLQNKYVYNSTPNGYNGGIWMSGAGPTVDADGNIYVSTGNGSAGNSATRNDPINRSESVIKLSPELKVLDFFTPSNYDILERDDLDYGVNGVLVMPNTNLVLSGSKEGKIYVNDKRNLGKFAFGDSAVVQRLYANLQNIYNRHVHGTPVYMKTDTSEYVYVWAESDQMRQFRFDRKNNRFADNPAIAARKLDYGMPGASLSSSSNGNQTGTGILWAAYATSGDANQMLRPGTLAAYDARNIGRVLWTSDDLKARDEVGTFAKFNPPVVANGRVYIPTFSNRINVYGLINSYITATEPVAEPFSAYPNPTTSEFTLRYTLVNPEPKLSVKIMDIAGREILMQPLDGQAGPHETRLSLGDNTPGVYQVVVQADGQTRQTLRVVKQ